MYQGEKEEQGRCYQLQKDFHQEPEHRLEDACNNSLAPLFETKININWLPVGLFKGDGARAAR